MALVSINKGDKEMAYAQLKEAARKTEASGYRYTDRIWLPWTQARLSVVEGNWTEAATAFEEAVEVVSSYNAHWYRAKWQLEWAEALLQHGQVEDKEKAKELIEEARSQFEIMGADAYVEQSSKMIENLA
jgi:ATP/maltotriose-dependent transcriptional regulator MalT